MSKLLLSLTGFVLVLSVLAADKPAGVEYQVYPEAYFEKNTSGLKGEASFLALSDKKGFDNVFGVGVVMGKKPMLLPEGAFDKQLVLAVIKRGNAVTTYKVDGVTADAGVLQLRYTATTGQPTTARFASPLIVAVPKGDYKAVNFIENGKKAGSIELGK